MTEHASITERARQSRRYLALWFPFLPTDRLRRQQAATASAEPDERPLVVVEKVRGAMRIAAVDRHAAQLGLSAGLTLADARARIPNLAAAESDPDADASLLEHIALFCNRYTPLVALASPHAAVLDITGCAHLFGGERRLRQGVLSRLAGMGIGLKATIAGTPDAALGLARFGNVEIVPEGEDEACVRRLPVMALAGIGSDTVLALSRAGLKTIGDLAARPLSVLAARFGQDLVTRLLRTLGREDVRITPLRPLPPISVERQFAEPLTQTECLMGVIDMLIGDAARILEERGEGGRAFEAGIFRSDGAVRRLVVETGRQSRDRPAILRLFRERMETLSDPVEAGFGFDAVRLCVLATEPLGVAEPEFGSSAVEAHAVADLVDRLVARLGRGRVLRFEARDTHDPERNARLVPAGGAAHSAPRSGSATPSSWPKPEPGEPPSRPLQMFDPPQPIEALAEIPDGPPMRFRWRRVLHEVASAEGPERIAPEWWRSREMSCDVPMRDYYRVEDSAGRRFWIFRDGLYGEGAASPRWYLHGLFA